jgi:hypothetical protein
VDRALDLQMLRGAIGEHPRLLSPENIREALLRAELDLFTGNNRFNDDLLKTGWYLNAVALTTNSVQGSEVQRQDAARVSAHIFDVHLELNGTGMAAGSYLRYLVAAQAGYLLGDVPPNATALAARGEGPEPSVGDPGLYVLHLTSLFLALDFRALGEAQARGRIGLAAMADVWGVPLESSPYASASLTLESIASLSRFLLFGDRQALTDAMEGLLRAVRDPFGEEDTDSRWAAALLLDLGEYLDRASLWTLMPDAPQVVQAFTHSDPPVAVLWPPQAAFVNGPRSPFDQSVRRQVLSFPTSAGKTLLAQLMICHHLSVRTENVCVVAPTHSLCRELKDALDPRLEHLGTWALDVGASGGRGELDSSARVVLMTPERLGAALRADPTRVLEFFSMFVIDEAHLLAQEQRGWGLEGTLSLLHFLTEASSHRIVVISAALGNTAQVSQWLTALDEEPVTFQQDWRGPRRLRAVYSPQWDWNAPIAQGGAGRQLPRRHFEIDGQLFLRGPDGVVKRGSFGSAGNYSQRQKRNGDWTADGEVSTPELQRLVPMLRHLVTGAGAPCLVVVVSRRDAKELARLVSEQLDPIPENAGLAGLLRAHLPASHSLPDLVARGVAYHHGVLPREVQAEVEAATRRRSLRCLVSTTTLTEGVNLPFKSVVIGRTGWGSGDNRQEILDPAGLLNAFGRAGRACRETEGWLLSCHFQKWTTSAFDVFDQTGADLPVISTLDAAAALEALESFDELVAEGTDAVLADTGLATNGFLAYVWLLADVLAQLRPGGIVGRSYGASRGGGPSSSCR